jgi:DNA (cytosine-5)-methyltransferase 1
MASSKPLVIDLFCGAGGMSTGFEMAGFEVILGIEYIDTYAETFANNHKTAETICGDIREVSVDQVKDIIGDRKVSVICGGPPCQGFSGAGRRDNKDPRNSLFMDFIRMVDGVKPDYFVMENVPGILTMKNEKGLAVIEIIKEEFKKIGYNVQWEKLIAADYGVPQKRRRVIFIGSKDDKNFPIVYPKKTHGENVNSKGQSKLDVGIEPVKEWLGAGTVLIPKDEVPAIYFHTQKMIDGFRRRKERNKMNGKGFGWQLIKLDKPCYTLSARYWKDGADALVYYSENEVRMLTEDECALIQTFPKKYKFAGSKRDKYTQVGNAVPCLMAKAIAKQLLLNIRIYMSNSPIPDEDVLDKLLVSDLKELCELNGLKKSGRKSELIFRLCNK